ncbi:Uncharacterised protein [Suttonella ornithocola]|uniref:Tc1-like transposase DDE domain-containing protein n=1 Tax=Suttonella ornithocola TaxID=279832 RepID=A0A380MND3_9GAMM|nr:Uncharacterised protein [Suttonella ornithocola]
MTYENTMTSAFFEKWFEEHLLPSLSVKSVIIMDNAQFHRMKVLKALAEKFGHVVLPLSPYSPELNLIEKQWGNLKSIYVKFYLILMSFGMLFCPILDLIDYKYQY